MNDQDIDYEKFKRVEYPEKDIIPKYKIYDRVTSKKTGLPMIGRVEGIVTASTFASNYGALLVEHKDMHPEAPMLYRYSEYHGGVIQLFQTWSEINPYWVYEPVYYVHPDSPQKNCSWEEYVRSCEAMGTEPTQEEYDALPNPKIITFPQFDLELI